MDGILVHTPFGGTNRIRFNGCILSRTVTAVPAPQCKGSMTK